MLDLIHEHSFVRELLVPGANVLDVGCRGFAIPRELAARGCRVVAMDPDPAIEDPQIDGVTFVREALVARAKPRRAEYASYGNGTGNFLLGGGAKVPREAAVLPVACVSLDEVSVRFGVPMWDAVKLDCEGAEYALLLDWPGPVAKQICVEFHEHTRYCTERGYFSRVLAHLGQWYDVVQHEASHQHGIPELNYWDSVFVLR